jgi:aminopeptidase N
MKMVYRSMTATLALMVVLIASCKAQSSASKTYTYADTLRGSIGAERAWWNVLRYDITVKPDYNNKTITGSNIITYTTTARSTGMQVDLQEPLVIDSIVLNQSTAVSFTKDGNAWHVQVPSQAIHTTHQLQVFYSGKVHEAVRPPWSGGWTFTKDSVGRPWMTVTCQGTGASIWYPCKDHQSDEPDKGASLTMIVPDTLMAVANGRLVSKKNNTDGTVSYQWSVVNPINNYNIIPYIGKYVHFSEVYQGEKGPLDLHYWVLDYNLPRASAYMPLQVHNMLKSLEYWFGPYPFYEDGYKLIDAPHSGMEHQSAIAYGNKYRFGYGGRDGSGTGWGLKWDFIIIHESGHEWFGNNITTNDLADMWVHEGFTNYSETLFTDYIFGRDAANAYNAGIRRGIRNDRTIIPVYGVNAQGSGDMYPKASNMLHAIRHGMGNDTLFRKIMRGLNSTFYHQTVTSQQVENYISKEAGYNYGKVFDQYLRTTQIPRFEYYFDATGKKVFYRYTNCVSGFNLPLVLQQDMVYLKIIPGETWKNVALQPGQQALFDTAAIVKMYYITVEEVKRK